MSVIERIRMEDNKKAHSGFSFVIVIQGYKG